MSSLKVALIGQSAFCCEVYKALRHDGHEVAGVFTLPDQNDREEPVG